MARTPQDLPQDPDQILAPEGDSPPADSPRPVCRCGFSRGHFMVSAEPDYAFSAWILLAIGVSASPRRIRYRCRRCEVVLEETRDPAVLKAHS